MLHCRLAAAGQPQPAAQQPGAKASPVPKAKPLALAIAQRQRGHQAGWALAAWPLPLPLLPLLVSLVRQPTAWQGTDWRSPLPCPATDTSSESGGAPFYSMLWGKAGEKWFPGSRLTDWSWAGYMGGRSLAVAGGSLLLSEAGMWPQAAQGGGGELCSCLPVSWHALGIPHAPRRPGEAHPVLSRKTV